ncbi:MAG: hypothetical protein H7Z11_18775 [Verrucomicrobia bacterium]|nr:hypothetical protein [Leptolyngbya sp. ES-bin-22]
MTSQLATDSPIRASNTQVQQTQSDEAVAVDQQRSRLIKAMKSQYQLDQQVKFLHLQAEADSLLQQLQAVKQQRQASDSQL